MTPDGARLDLTHEQVKAALFAFGIQPSDEQVAKILEYISLLLKWNKSMSLTSIMRPDEIVSRHFGESMFAASLLPVENCRLADVGSGAGFPGLALKILCPSLRVTLIESNKRKSAFLSEVIHTLKLSRAEIRSMRFEEMRPDPGSFDLVVARALGGFPQLLRWAKQALSQRGHLMLWVGGEDATRVSNAVGWIWDPAVRIPESQRRLILVGQPSVEQG